MGLQVVGKNGSRGTFVVLQTHSVPQRAALALQYVILSSFWQAVATAALG